MPGLKAINHHLKNKQTTVIYQPLFPAQVCDFWDLDTSQ